MPNIPLPPELKPDRFIDIHRRFVRVFGQWLIEYPADNIMFWVRLFYRVFMWWALTILPVGGEIYYLYNTGDNVANIAEGLYLMLSEAYAGIKIQVFNYNRKKVLKVFDHMHHKEFLPTEPEHLEFIRHAVWQGRSITKAFTYICVSAIIVKLLTPIATNFEELPANVQFPMMDVMKSPVYPFVYVWQCLYRPCQVLLDVAMDTIVPSLISCACQLDILSFNLENIQMLSERYIMENNDLYKSIGGKHIDIPDHILQATVKMKLGEYIKHHVSIVSYVSKIEDAFSVSAALQFMLSTLVLCLVGVEFLAIDDPSNQPLQLIWMCLYLGCMLFEVFMLCWFGNKLIIKSDYLRQAAFNSNWISYSEDVKRSFKIFIERMKNPLTLTAGKVFILSLDTFKNLLKCSYNAFAVLR